MKKALYILLIFFLGFPNTSQALHLVGGEVTYECIGNGFYRITLTIYRDCNSSGAQFDPQAAVSIYRGTTLFKNLSINVSPSTTLPLTAPNNCTQLPSTVCTEKAFYVDTAYLPPHPDGYIISHQRCCRNSTIANINNSPSNYGNTYTINIFPNDLSCNSSPVFKEDPPVILCLNVALKLDLGATDADGDSLVYELCDPLNGGGNNPGTAATDPNGVAPNPATRPPYAAVPFRMGFSKLSPLPANPGLKLNSRTGILTGRPNQVGQYVFAVCVKEYRNGTIISTVRRDFQFNVSGACQSIIAAIDAQGNDTSVQCNGKTLTFTQSSVNATSYFWDFGDPAISFDTSTVSSPTYTFSDTGKYVVTLIVNKGTSCADTSTSIFEVNDPLSVSFDHRGNYCFDQNFLDFNVFGDFSPDANFTWNFGGNTNQNGQVFPKEPKAISFLMPGTYIIQLKAEDFGCEAIFIDTVRIYENPKFRHEVPITRACNPTRVNFRDSSIADGPIDHYWNFGDGTTSNMASPSHVYTQAGVYTVSHTIVSRYSCVDTISEIFADVITVLPSPEARLSVDQEEADILKPLFVITNQNDGLNISTETHLPGGQILYDFNEQSLKFSDTGVFLVKHIAINEFGCTDTLFQYLKVSTPLRFYIPNAFSPNGDGINDELIISIIGAKYSSIYIYSRWGELVFSTEDISLFWNGQKFNGGSILPIGTYTYIAKASNEEDGGSYLKKGTITLIR